MSQREYVKLVLAAFEQKLNNNLLPLELVSPTRKSLKKLSYHVCLERYDPKDELLLSSFFGSRESAGAYANAIDLSSAEKFRTLHNFLIDKTESTDFININMIAWLIDFQPRPYHENLRISSPVQPESTDVTHIIVDVQPANDSVPEQVMEETGEGKAVPVAPTIQPGGLEPPPATSARTFASRWLIGTDVFLVFALAIWMLWPVSKCMYWDNDHYIATSCSVPKVDTPLIKLDPVKLHGFKRLHHVDTLTYNSVGKFGYVRVAGIIEVYTAKGKHPLYPEKKLLPLTYYAVNVCKKQHGY